MGWCMMGKVIPIIKTVDDLCLDCCLRVFSDAYTDTEIVDIFFSGYGKDATFNCFECGDIVQYVQSGRFFIKIDRSYYIRGGKPWERKSPYPESDTTGIDPGR